MRTSLAAILVLILFGVYLVDPAVAQLDREEQLASLEAVGRFGLVLDVEASKALAGDPAIDVPGLRVRLADVIESMTGRRPDPDPLESGAPYLYVHVNAHDAGQGLVPFAVNASFVQQARLSAGGRQLMAATWESGFVGIVSYDRLAGITDAAEAVCREFAAALAAATSEMRAR